MPYAPPEAYLGPLVLGQPLQICMDAHSKPRVRCPRHDDPHVALPASCASLLQLCPKLRAIMNSIAVIVRAQVPMHTMHRLCSTHPIT